MLSHTLSAAEVDGGVVSDRRVCKHCPKSSGKLWIRCTHNGSVCLSKQVLGNMSGRWGRECLCVLFEWLYYAYILYMSVL